MGWSWASEELVGQEEDFKDNKDTSLEADREDKVLLPDIRLVM